MNRSQISVPPSFCGIRSGFTILLLGLSWHCTWPQKPRIYVNKIQPGTKATGSSFQCPEPGFLRYPTPSRPPGSLPEAPHRPVLAVIPAHGSSDELTKQIQLRSGSQYSLDYSGLWQWESLQYFRELFPINRTTSSSSQPFLPDREYSSVEFLKRSNIGPSPVVSIMTM